MIAVPVADDGVLDCAGIEANERSPPATWLSTEYSKMVSMMMMPSGVVTAHAEYSFSPTK
jgi:hypothetical protein